MKPATVVIPALAAGGVALLAALFVAHDSSTRLWQPKLTRGQAIGVAQKLANEYGTNITRWPTYVTARIDRTHTSAQRVFGQNAMTRVFNPMQIRVLAVSPDGGEAILVTLAPDGRPMGYLDRHPKMVVARGKDADGEGLAQRELRRYAGESAGQFTQTAAGLRTQEGWRSAYEWSDSRLPGMVGHLEIVTSGSRVVRVNYSLDVAARVLGPLREENTRMQGVKAAMQIVIIAALTLLATYLVFARLTRRKDHTTFGRQAVLIAVIPMVLAVVSGAARSAGSFRSFDGGGLGDAQWVTTLALDGFIALTAFVLVASGYSILPLEERPRWLGLRLVTLGRLGDRYLGREVALGLVAGAGLACLPYVVAALPLPGGWPVEIFDPVFLYVPAPAFAPFTGLMLAWETYGFFALALPWAVFKIRRPVVRWGVLSVAGVAFAAAHRDPFPYALGADLVFAALLLGGFVCLYRATGLLAVWVAPVGLWAAIYTATFLAAGQAAGWWLIAMQAAVLAAAICVWIFGQRTDEEAVLASMEPGELGLSRSDRERLRAEFRVARRAQQGMLPAEAPEIPGFTIQGSCEPAREVGGDLFDYLPFPNGQWGFCVADVSGKGVPAALYMTLTKGMLASAQTRDPDLPVIASRLNRFVAETGKKRTFITMSLGLLDAQRRVFRHVRAGHNPPVHYRASTKECLFLQPKGLGLGITASLVFERNLEVQDVALEPGDAIVLYSDGLTECMNSKQEQFGEDRLVEVVRRAGHLNARGLEAAIMDAAREFRGEADPHDDLTVVVLRAENSPASRRSGMPDPLR